MEHRPPPSPGVGPPANHRLLLENLIVAALQQDASHVLLPPDLSAALLGTSWDPFKSDTSLITDKPVIHYNYRTIETNLELEENVPLFKYLAFIFAECHDLLRSHSNVFELLVTFKQLIQLVKFEMHVQEPYFSQLRDGLKTVEGRCATGAYNSILPEDVILFNNSLTLVVEGVKQYKSFEKMLKAESLNAVLPGVNNIIEGNSTLKKRSLYMVS